MGARHKRHTPSQKRRDSGRTTRRDRAPKESTRPTRRRSPQVDRARARAARKGWETRRKNERREARERAEHDRELGLKKKYRDLDDWIEAFDDFPEDEFELEGSIEY